MDPGRLFVMRALATAVDDPETFGRTVMVGIDGVDGAGKTRFADDLAAVLRDTGRPVVRVSVDGFHRPAAERYRLGRHSPVGFFQDSYDYDALISEVLAPLSPGGSRLIRTAVRDVTTDTASDGPAVAVPDDVVLVVDGIFLHRDELHGWWDTSVFLEVPFVETFRRMAVRDGCPPDPSDPTNARYVEGQRLYLQHRPQERATFVIDNSDPRRPVVH